MNITIYDLRLQIADWREPMADWAKSRALSKNRGSTILNPQSEIGSRKRSRRGLTLIEVMLSIVILGIGTGVLLLATAKCLAIVTKSQRYSTAQRLIQQVGAEHPLTRSEIEPGTESGRFDDEEDYRWEREIIENEDENEYRKGLYTVRTRVIWSDRGQNSFEETVTWLYITPEEEL